MNKKIVALLTCVLLLVHFGNAGQVAAFYVKPGAPGTIENAFSKKKTERGDSIDIIHYDLNLNIRNLASRYISGFALLSVFPKVDSLTTIKLDLLRLSVSNVSVQGNTVPFFQNDSELFVILNMRSPAHLPDSTISLRVEYGGQPVTDPAWGGFYFSGNYAYNMGVGFKSNPHNFGRCWFPCIDNFTDRATYTFHITTDSSFVAVSNGLKQPEINHPDGSITWNWAIDQPIPTYLASVAVGKYQFVKYEFQGMSHTYPVWLAVEAKDTAKARASFVRLNNALQCFEQKFGAYPFDRVGYVGVPFSSGAMEHATNIAYPLYAIDGTTNYETLFAHELSHMWWGDKATCRTAEDIWLNEGWASFCEALFLQCVYGEVRYFLDIQYKLAEVLKNAPLDDGGFYPVSGIPANITYGTHVYKKGALMAHTLRTIMGDAAFFTACKSYLDKHAFKDVSSDDLRAEFQSFTTADLSNFFAIWIYEKGNVDVVASDVYSNLQGSTAFMRVKLQQLQRYKSGVSTGLPVKVTAYDKTGNTASFTFVMGAVLDTTVYFNGNMGPAAYITVNEDLSLALGKTINRQTVKTTGNIALPDQLTSVNVQQINDSAVLVMEHHWTEPTQGALRTRGIRISPERYWHVDGILPSGFKAWAFFSYDGSSGNYLDRELITRTEDSLVLLYRARPTDEWQEHTDNTFQPGASKTDKIGRFWVNELKTGDYAFGMRDVRVTGLKEIVGNTPKAAFTIIPNPAGAALSVTLRFDQPTAVDTITILDPSGKQVASYTLHQLLTQYEADISRLKAGSYIMVVKGVKGTQSKAFIR